MMSIARGRQFLRYVLPGVMRPLRILWNQMIGFVFVVLALAAVPRTYHSVREFNGGPESFFRLLLSALFIAMMSGFGIYSFWRAHKVPKG